MHDAKENIDFLDFLKEDFEVQAVERHPAISQIEEHLPTISKLSLMAKNLTVDDDQGCAGALDVTSDIRSLFKTIEELRKKAIEPARRIVQMINDSAKGLQEILKIAEGEVLIKIAAFKKREAEKMEVAEVAVKKLSEELGIDIAFPSGASNVHSSKASTYQKEVTTFEIVDVNLIPDLYWIVDEKLIQKHIDLGKQDIPGIKIVKEKKMLIRRK